MALSHAKALHITLGLRNVLCENIGVLGEILKYLPEEAAILFQFSNYQISAIHSADGGTEQSSYKPWRERNLPAHGPLSYIQTAELVQERGQLKHGKHDSQLGLPSASASGPPHTARGAPALTQQAQRCYLPGCISLAP